MKMMKRSGLWLLIAAAIVPASAFAQNPWDGTFNFEDLNDNFLGNPLVDAKLEEGDDAEDDNDYPATVTDEIGIDDYAEFKLLEAILNDNTKPHHAEIRDAFTDTYPIVDNRVKNTQAGVIFRVPGSKVLTGFMIRNIDLAVELGKDFDIENANAFTQEELDSAVELSDLLSASGDLDDDNVTNLEEWELSGTSALPYAERVSLFITLATAGSTATVDVTPAENEIVVGQTLQLSAASTELTDTFTWESSNDEVATVSATGLVTGVSRGSVTITATGSESGASGEASVEVLFGQWFDLCSLDDTFEAQGGVFGALGSQLGLPFSSWSEFDIDFDGVPDQWQVAHVAFALCEGNTQVNADYAANVAAVNTLVSELVALLEFLDDADDAMLAFSNTLANSVDAAFCNDPANLFPPDLASGYAGVFGATPINLAYAALAQEAGDAVDDFAPVAAVLPSLAQILGALAGMSSEAAATVSALVPVSDIADLQLAIGTLLAGVAQFQGQCLAGAEATEANNLMALLATFPTVNVPSFAVYDAGSKAVGEDFAGLGDYDNDGVTNFQVAQLVDGAGGDSSDYVAGVTGVLGPFWAGNPNLPAAGLLGLGVVLSALSATGAFALRRKK